MDGFADPLNPTVDEVLRLTEGFFDPHQEALAGRVPVHYVLTANSSDGQRGSEGIAKRLTIRPDFAEQSVYYEAFFRALADETWIDGAFTERWDWFDQYRRSGDTPEAIYFDQTIETSPRSKPAEEVVRLWFGIY